MEKKKILIIALSLMLMAGTVAMAAYTRNDKLTGVKFSVSPNPVQTILPVSPAPQDQFLVTLKTDKKGAYIALGSKLTLSAGTEGVPEGKKCIYHWEMRLNDGEWNNIDNTKEPTIEVTVKDQGKISYRCTVNIIGSAGTGVSSAPLEKTGYRDEVTMQIGRSYSKEVILNNIFGKSLTKAEKKEIKFKGTKKYNQCLMITGKQAVTVKKYCKKLSSALVLETPGGEKLSPVTIFVKWPSAKEFRKKVNKPELTNHKTKLTIYFKDIIGVSVIKFGPKNQKAGTIEVTESKATCKLTYRNKNKFRVKKFKVRLGYKQFGKKGYKYTKWMNLTI